MFCCYGTLPMSITPKYSVCSTIYNSANTLEEALKPLCALGAEFEIIIIDNFSNDETVKILKKYAGMVKYKQINCSRGLGKQKAIEFASGKYIIQVDLDVKYVELSNIIKENQVFLDEFILNIQSVKTKCNTPILIGKKELFNQIGGYPDLNFVEDLYFYNKAEAIGKIKYIKNNYEHICLNISGKSSGVESRYEKSFFKKARRRVIACRDLIFVTNITYNELMKWYKLEGSKRIYMGVPLFTIGKILSFFVKVPTLESEIMRMKKNHE